MVTLPGATLPGDPAASLRLLQPIARPATASEHVERNERRESAAACVVSRLLVMSMSNDSSGRMQWLRPPG